MVKLGFGEFNWYFLVVKNFTLFSCTVFPFQHNIDQTVKNNSKKYYLCNCPAHLAFSCEAIHQGQLFAKKEMLNGFAS
ncbi:MAG: hypothetical protein OFPI_03310 [Osedax symbiont Rs2]|nr:MAG: hypothetical protein OFPI_03310 [Osedax symbiont Rs2]